jgi:hypothetical protein
MELNYEFTTRFYTRIGYMEMQKNFQKFVQKKITGLSLNDEMFDQAYKVGEQAGQEMVRSSLGLVRQIIDEEITPVQAIDQMKKIYGDELDKANRQMFHNMFVEIAQTQTVAPGGITIN